MSRQEALLRAVYLSARANVCRDTKWPDNWILRPRQLDESRSLLRDRPLSRPRYGSHGDGGCDQVKVSIVIQAQRSLKAALEGLSEEATRVVVFAGTKGPTLTSTRVERHARSEMECQAEKRWSESDVLMFVAE